MITFVYGRKNVERKKIDIVEEERMEKFSAFMFSNWREKRKKRKQNYNGEWWWIKAGWNKVDCIILIWVVSAVAWKRKDKGMWNFELNWECNEIDDKLLFLLCTFKLKYFIKFLIF